MILIIDNYDSFTWNLVQLTGQIDPDIRVIRNDELTLDQIEALHPSHMILSPGPGRPEDAGVTMEAVTRFAGQIPILGVCLGHQAICTAYGGTVTHAPRLMHGKASQVEKTGDSVLLGDMPAVFQAGRYHSLAAEESSLPSCLRVTARSQDGQVMAVEHETLPVFGVQFHPESILTPQGQRILDRFLATANPGKAPAARRQAASASEEGRPA